MADLRVENHGSVFLFIPESQAGRNWLLENTSSDLWLGTALAVEHRYASNLADGAVDDGLEVV